MTILVIKDLADNIELDANAMAVVSGGWYFHFDEADALFGKRSEVKDSHDRYGVNNTNALTFWM